MTANEVTSCLLIVVDGYGDGFQEGSIFGCESVFIGKERPEQRSARQQQSVLLFLQVSSRRGDPFPQDGQGAVNCQTEIEGN